VEELIVTGLLALSAMLVAPLLVKCYKLIGVQIAESDVRQTLARNEALEQIIRLAVTYAEERAAKHFQSGSSKMQPAVKMQHAVRFVQQRFPHADAGDLEQIIEATLPAAGLGAASK
jgi:biopolymer transport protein ExbB/TolQ